MRATDIMEEPDQPLVLKDGQGILVEWASSTVVKTALSDVRSFLLSVFCVLMCVCVCVCVAVMCTHECSMCLCVCIS